MEFLKGMGIAEESVVPSARSVGTTRRLEDEAPAEGLIQMTMDSEALLATLLFWSMSLKTLQDRRMSEGLLEDWLRTIIGREAMMDWAWVFEEFQDAGGLGCGDPNASLNEHCIIVTCSLCRISRHGPSRCTGRTSRSSPWRCRRCGVCAPASGSGWGCCWPGSQSPSTLMLHKRTPARLSCRWSACPGARRG